MWSYPQKQHKVFVERDRDIIIINSIDNAQTASQFIRAINDGIQKGYESFCIELDRVTGVFPNAAVPIAGLIEYYSSKGITFEYPDIPTKINHFRIFAPKEYSPIEHDIMDKVWRFTNSKDVGLIVDAYIEELQKSAMFYPGVLKTIGWSLNEVMDNVIQHSKVSCGYVMGQIHLTTKNIAFAVFDSGQGIYNSLKDSKYHPKNPVDAITLAIQEEITRDKEIGQGNGLYGLHSIIQKGKGSLSIVSGRGSYSYFPNGTTKTYSSLPFVSYQNQCTTIDFQLNYSKDMSLGDALFFKGKKYEIVNLLLERYEDDYGHVSYKIKEHAEGTGTRQAAIRVKNEIINIIREEKKPITLDFEGVDVMSSSFADELLAKLFIDLGLFQFNLLVKLKNIDESLQMLLHKSVLQRIVESISEEEESQDYDY